MEVKRNNGLDICRVLSMCGIIGLHVMNAGGGNSKYRFPFSARYFNERTNCIVLPCSQYFWNDDRVALYK